MWGPARVTGLPLGLPSNLRAPEPNAQCFAGAMHAHDPLHDRQQPVDLEFTELGKIAGTKFNKSIASYVGDRLFSEGFSTVKELHEHLQHETVSEGGLDELAVSLIEAGPAPMLAQKALSFVLEYAFRNADVLLEHTEDTARASAQPDNRVGGCPPRGVPTDLLGQSGLGCPWSAGSYRHLPQRVIVFLPRT